MPGGAEALTGRRTRREVDRTRDQVARVRRALDHGRRVRNDALVAAVRARGACWASGGLRSVEVERIACVVAAGTSSADRSDDGAPDVHDSVAVVADPR